ncbi:hypothetical protein [Jongsikchunia kroppenstedtii]|uniref:hypothetical protein n=1 Tax=Jongsikchunia kroppenstedtii TaxID=1121721 RepID=UPI00037C2E6B|nr:hypothetical protein [Jongsikchunia kroppenstedtii]
MNTTPDTATETTGQAGTTETATPAKTRNRRIVESFACLAAVAGVSCVVGAGVAGATPPAQQAGQATTTMTITNHTNQLEWLLSSNTTGNWVVPPQVVLMPGASETIVVSQPRTDWQRTIVNYRVGLIGPQATYAAANTLWAVGTEMTGVTGGPGWISNQVVTRHPNATVRYDLW